jgi:hypothetical protein
MIQRKKRHNKKRRSLERRFEFQKKENYFFFFFFAFLAGARFAFAGLRAFVFFLADFLAVFFAAIFTVFFFAFFLAIVVLQCVGSFDKKLTRTVRKEVTQLGVIYIDLS